MPQKIEVELRILLKNRKAIEEKIKNQSAKLIYYTHLIDHWYCPQNVKNYKEACTDNIGYALRIREAKDEYTGRHICSLECKTLCNGINHAFCNESEIDINDIEQAQNILKAIGLKEFLTIDKERTIYKKEEVKYCFDKIKGLGEGLELEIMTNKKNIKKAHQKMKKKASELGIKKEEILDRSLTYLAMKKLAIF